MGFYLTVISLVAEGGGDAVLDSFDPSLSQLLGVCLHHTAPVGADKRHTAAVGSEQECLHQKAGRLVLHLATFLKILMCSLS